MQKKLFYCRLRIMLLFARSNSLLGEVIFYYLIEGLSLGAIGKEVS